MNLTRPSVVIFRCISIKNNVFSKRKCLLEQSEKGTEQSEKILSNQKKLLRNRKRLPKQSEKGTEQLEKVKSNLKKVLSNRKRLSMQSWHDWSSKGGRLIRNNVCRRIRMYRHDCWAYGARVLMYGPFYLGIGLGDGLSQAKVASNKCIAQSFLDQKTPSEPTDTQSTKRCSISTYLFPCFFWPYFYIIIILDSQLLIPRGSESLSPLCMPVSPRLAPS